LNQTADLSFTGKDLDTTDVAVKTGGKLDLIQTGEDTMLLDMKVRSSSDVTITSPGDIDLSGMDLFTTGTLTVRSGGSIIVGSSILVATNGVIFEADSDGDGNGLIDIASGSTSYVTAQAGDVVMTAAEQINIGGDHSFAAIQALNGSLHISSDSDGNGDGLISVSHASTLLSASMDLTIGSSSLADLNFVGTMLTAGNELSVFASQELVFQDVSLDAEGDTTLSALGSVLFEDGEILSAGSVINLISDADNSLDGTDTMNLSGELDIQVEDGNVVITGVEVSVDEEVSFVAQLVTINGEALGAPVI